MRVVVLLGQAPSDLGRFPRDADTLADPAGLAQADGQDCQCVGEVGQVEIRVDACQTSKDLARLSSGVEGLATAPRARQALTELQQSAGTGRALGADMG